jgi:type I restriction enzyme S subunit
MAMDRPWISSGLKCAVVDKIAAGSLLVQRVARLRPKSPEHEMFVFNCLQGNDFKNHCRITETTIPHISPKDFATFPVANANEDELRTFSGIAGKVRSMTGKAVMACNSANQLQASLQDSIFALN